MTIRLLALAYLGATLGAQEAEFFRQNCYNCHTIGGGRLTGPDLKGVLERKDRGWLVQFIQNPKAVIDRGDPYALRLQQEARGVVMPTVPGLTPARAAALLDLIAAESKLAKSQFAGVQISDRPFTAQDVELGRRIFLGAQRLSGGGPNCISCHALSGVGGLGGGGFGPDLTKAYERLGGRKAMGAWLSAPPMPTMQAVFRSRPMTPEEILPLLALFENAARSGGQADGAAQLNFLLLGLGGAVLFLFAFDAAWRRRFRGVRRPLIQAASARERAMRGHHE